jgi:UDP-N-acetylmuramate dehydrogenase
MMNDELLVLLEAQLKRDGLHVRRNEPMSEHTTYQIGGPADLFVVAASKDQLIFAVKQARALGITPFVLGGGANLLVADAGIRGLVIHFRASQYTFQEKEGEILLWAEAGASFKELARESIARGLEGIEWAVDLPGSIGGAVVGNAGAYGGYICDCIRKATVLEPDDTINELQTEEMVFCYRGSKFKQQPRYERSIILDVTLALRSGDVTQLAKLSSQYTKRRWERQPQDPSCGSVFKRTARYPAGFLIEQCGLKAERRGNAMISPKHANFIVNMGGAKARDVQALIELARERVKAQFDEDLELEVELVGEW